MKHQKVISMFLALLFLFGCSACGKIKIHTDDSPPVNEIREHAQIPSGSAALNPLSGEPEQEDLSALRPFAVMVNNISVALPHIGVGGADWIYEIEAEGGITRMMALYSHIQDVPSIGSVRSMRPYFLSLAMSYDAIMIHAGGSDDAYADCETYQWDHLDGVRDAAAYSAVFYRDPSRTAHGIEHSVFLYGNRVSDYSDQRGFRRSHNDGYETGLAFSAESVSQCVGDAVSVEVNLSSSKKTSFSYHSDIGKYTGFQYGETYIDGADGSPVLFSNLLILLTQVTDYHDALGHIAVDVVGSGTGFYFTGGRWLDINWSRDSVDGPFRYTAKDGTPITLTPGKTYCAFVSAEQNAVTFY